MLVIRLRPALSVNFLLQMLKSGDNRAGRSTFPHSREFSLSEVSELGILLITISEYISATYSILPIRRSLLLHLVLRTAPQIGGALPPVILPYRMGQKGYAITTLAFCQHRNERIE